MPSVEIQPKEAVVYGADGKPLLIAPANPGRATQITPRLDLLKDIDEPLAVDIEFQEYKPKDSEKWAHRIGRIAFVNTRGDVIYDCYFRYEFDEEVNVKMPPAHKLQAQLSGSFHTKIANKQHTHWQLSTSKLVQAELWRRASACHSSRPWCL